jgi:hypothetical protein
MSETRAQGAFKIFLLKDEINPQKIKLFEKGFKGISCTPVKVYMQAKFQFSEEIIFKKMKFNVNCYLYVVVQFHFLLSTFI